MIALDVLIVVLLLSWISALIVHMGAGMTHLLIVAALILSFISHIGGTGDTRRRPRHR